jgi:hypothetical protein
MSKHKMSNQPKSRALSWIALLLLGITPSASELYAQDPADTALHVLTESVRFANGRPVIGATVIVQRTDDSVRVARVATTDGVGKFTIEGLRAGTYQARVYGQGRWFVQQIIVGEGADNGGLRVPVRPARNVGWTVICLIAYLLTILLTRWHHIARSIHVMLYRHLTAVLTRIHTEVDAGDTRLNHLKETTEKLQKEFEPKTLPDLMKFGAVWEFLFWSRGRENAAWVALHEIERQLTAFLAPPEYVESYLHWADGQLRVIASPSALGLANIISVNLSAEPTTDANVRSSRERTRKALLGRALSVIYAERDMTFSTLMDWHNKASWLIFAALIFMGFLAAAVGNSVLFLAGAAGGFLSRVMRALKREDVPLDYGASWTTLFLSPIFGALAGWFGILLIEMLTSGSVNVLGDMFDIVNWYDPLSPGTLGLAFGLGFSERFFDAVVGAVERHAEGARKAEEAAKVAVTQPVTTAAPDAVKSSQAVRPVTQTPTPEINGVRIDLPDEPIAVQKVSGKITLLTPAESDVAVELSSNDPSYDVTPRIISIAKGGNTATFDVVPKGDAPARTVSISAQLGTVIVSDVIEFGRVEDLDARG